MPDNTTAPMDSGFRKYLRDMSVRNRFRAVNAVVLSGFAAYLLIAAKASGRTRVFLIMGVLCAMYSCLMLIQVHIATQSDRLRKQRAALRSARP